MYSLMEGYITFLSQPLLTCKDVNVWISNVAGFVFKRFLFNREKSPKLHLPPNI